LTPCRFFSSDSLVQAQTVANPRAEGITAPLAADLLFIALMWIKAVTRRVG